VFNFDQTHRYPFAMEHAFTNRLWGLPIFIRLPNAGPALANRWTAAPFWGVSNGERTMAILIDFVLFSCVAAFVTGIVIAAAKFII
jgi:hypothetical protein